MFDNIISYSVKNKFVIGLMVLALMIWGVFSIRQIPIDAIPDITNNQVMVMTNSPTLATQEVEQFITTPIELSLQTLQNVEEIRSISRFGLSVVTVVFEEGYDVYLARQLVNEKLKEAVQDIPAGLGTPVLGPISTGLGEIYQYVVRPTEGFKDKYSLTELRTFQEWIVRRQLLGIEGVADVNTMGGFLKQYEVAVDPYRLKSMSVTINDIFSALELSNENTGGAYIEKGSNAYYIRSEGLARNIEDIENIVVKNRGGSPILIKDIAKVIIGSAPRFGALVRDGEEAVGGRVMMFKGANSSKVTELVKERVLTIQKSLPEGVIIEPYLVRDKLVKTAIGTVVKNLIEGGLIVVFILVLLLGNWRAGLIVASVIPLAMLFAISMMNLLGISANLMSLGAIDFGLIVDGAVIIVESIVHRLHVRHTGLRLTKTQMDHEVINSSQKIRSSAAFGEIIILIVYIPILTLVGIEGKMFKPMAMTVMLAIGGALILSLTYVPMMVALCLDKSISSKVTFADRMITKLENAYLRVLNVCLNFKTSLILGSVIVFTLSIWAFSRMGGEFIPTLEEGDLAMQQILMPGTSLSQSIEMSKMIQNKLMNEFPEIEDIVTNIGNAEIATDPMPVEIGDATLVMKPKSEWTSADNRNELYEKMEKSLSAIPGVGYEFSQPIQLRTNELMTGTKADIAIKLYGDDLDILFQKAKEAEKIINKIAGVGTVNVEQTIGMPQLIVTYDYAKLAQYGLHIKEVNQVIRAAFAGEIAGEIYEGEKRFSLVVRLDQLFRKELTDVEDMFISSSNGIQVPLSAVAKVELEDAPMQISRENTNRTIVIGVNVGSKDMATLVAEIQDQLDAELKLPVGYFLGYGGQFENLQAANKRLMVAVPIALGLIFILLYFTFGSVSQAVLIFTAIPLSAIGGIWALQLRGMPFSISAGIGFIALFGVAVLNGIVLIGYFNQLKKEGMKDLKERIFTGTRVRLRPILMTGAVASLGFLPMALSTSGGAEVQRPLATVVIGGLITATILTLIILPILYQWLETRKEKNLGRTGGTLGLFLLLIISLSAIDLHGQTQIALDDAILMAIKNNPSVKVSSLEVDKNMALQNMKYNLGPTTFNYQGEALFRPNGQQFNQLNFSQSIPNPSVIKSLNAVNSQYLAQSQIDKSISIADLTLNVKNQYHGIQYHKSMARFYEKMLETYNEYLVLAQTRVERGIANNLEKLSLQSKYDEYKLLLDQEGMRKRSLERQLQLTLNSSDELTTSEDLDRKQSTLGDGADDLFTKRAKVEVELEKTIIGVLESGTKPSFHLGYGLQYYYDGGLLSGLQMGMTIPLFKNNTKQKIAGQNIQIQASEARAKKVSLEVESKKMELLNAMEVSTKGMEYYSEQLERINPELSRITELNYKAGELSFLELVNVLSSSAQNQVSYLNQLYEYQKALSAYQYLSNQN